jgi:hypothetical protein
MVTRETVDEPVVETVAAVVEEPEAAEPEAAVPNVSGEFFSLGDIKRIDSVPDHKPPS